MIDTNVSVEVIRFIHRMGLISSRIGLLLWFISFQLIGSSKQKMSKYAIFGSLSILLGLSAGYNHVSVEYTSSSSGWIINYDNLGVFLLVLTYATFVAYQMIIYYTRLYKSRYAVINTQDSKSDLALVENAVIYGYFIIYSLAIITFVMARFPNTLVPATTWILFGGFSQLLLTIAITRYPRAFLLGKLFFHEFGLYSTSDGLTLFHVSSESVEEKEDFLTVALKGLENVISKLIGAQEPLSTLGFGDRAIILSQINSHYLYAVVNDPNYIARDIMRSFSNKWRRIYQSFHREFKLGDLTNPVVQEFIHELKSFLI